MTATATAFAAGPALEPAITTGAPVPDERPERAEPNRPCLRLIDGEGHRGLDHDGYRSVAPSPLRSVPTVSIEVYRRRRFFALVAATLIILGGAWVAGVSVTDFSGARLAEASTAAPTIHVVLPGDSYAAIAADLGAANPIASGQVLRAANGGGELIVGQRLVIDPANLTGEFPVD